VAAANYIGLNSYSRLLISWKESKRKNLCQLENKTRSSPTLMSRFRVELPVDDGNDSAILRHVDDKARQKRYTYTGSSGELADKDFVFHIRVTPYNFTLNHRAFTVSAISDDSFFRTQAESSSSNQVQSWAGKLEKHQPVPAIQLMR
ncbi:LOW QUALITY PROTEIN: hypothetical protein HID58_071355, partial [Brassica napus]